MSASLLMSCFNLAEARALCSPDKEARVVFACMPAKGHRFFFYIYTIVAFFLS